MHEDRTPSYRTVNHKYTIPGSAAKAESKYTPEQYEQSWQETKLLMKRLQLLARGIDK
jgi:hypothetical protein